MRVDKAWENLEKLKNYFGRGLKGNFRGSEKDKAHKTMRSKLLHHNFQIK